MMGDQPQTFIRDTFWCTVSALGQTNHRLIQRYTRFPWRLAILVHGEVSEADKVAVIQEFLALPTCCQSEGFCQPLRSLMGPNGSIRDLLEGGSHYLLLKATFACYPFNISIENAFARLKSQQKTCRGRADLTHNLCSKHVLSEVKAAHLNHVKAEFEAIQATLSDAFKEQMHQDQEGSLVSAYSQVLLFGIVFDSDNTSSSSSVFTSLPTTFT